jgi:putative redox protein
MNRAEIRFGAGKLEQEITVGPHRLKSDAPVEQGGEASGPSPHDYLALALGACTGLTLRMYAQRKAWALEDVRTVVSLDHTNDVAHFERVITLVGSLDETQKSRLLEIANHCPIHKALTGKIEVETRLA